MEKSYKPLSDASNLKYPFVLVNENKELLTHPYSGLNTFFDSYNTMDKLNREANTTDKANISLFTDRNKFFNFDINIGSDNGSLPEQLNKLLQKNITDKSLQSLHQYLKGNDLLEQQNFDAEFAEQIGLF